ncbi:MAG TPA: amylo-alpha-1,6-glucosidase [Gemmataceae bacterium]|nr:amylo-alpha-1,6-glucosidase [Gemmataceae bacterium]
MDDLVRRMPWREVAVRDPETLLGREWLVTNGLGGYASGTVAGVATRRYHGLLVAALPAPLGRMVLLNHLSEQFRLPDGRTVQIGSVERAGAPVEVHGAAHLAEFRLEAGLPVWRYELDGFVLEKRLLMPHQQNTVHICYHVVSGDGTLRVKLRPALQFRGYEAPVSAPLVGPYTLTAVEDRIEVRDGQDLPPLRMKLHGRRSSFTVEGETLIDVFYRLESERGYDCKGDLWCPGRFRADLSRDEDVTLVASTEIWDTVRALSPGQAQHAERERRRRLLSQADPAARQGVAAELVLAADQFLITPAGRTEEAARAHAAGDEVRTVIAGYHWFTDWGRDTMISLEGLTLTTGRHQEAGCILRTFSHYVRDGLIPNFFPDGEKEGLYHTADATLWFFHALHRYLQCTGDRATLFLLLPVLRGIVHHHLKGTRFGIHVDPKDGLLCEGAPGYQLTWMDAKVGDWVVTPRRGKAVEINALWYNALRLLEGWVREAEGDAAAKPLTEQADRARQSFNARFWYEKGGYLYDVVDGEQGDDPSLRPNQVIAISLEHPVLEESRWGRVLEVVREHLLTPVGLRSLAPGSPDYKKQYFGDLRARDAAYHQGTVWAWLIGPFIDAWLRVHPGDPAAARQFLKGFKHHLGEACIGSISEVFDAEPPYTPRGCIAQAWSVAEVLRCWVKTAT